jgi:hypothetical protein
MKRLLTHIGLLFSVLLTGCATTFTSQVSSFNEWSDNIQKTYIFERAPAQENNPEYKVYENQLRTRLGTLGFQETSGEVNPALKIGMQYATTLSEVQISDPWHPALYDPYWGLHFSRGYYFGRPYYPYFPGRYYMRGTDLSIRAYYLHQLQITMSDFSNNKKLADIRVSTEELNPEISSQMPLMIESALKNFPGKNGSTVTVEIPLK